MKKKGFLAVVLAVLTAGAASAQYTISGGFALSYMNINLEGGNFGYSFKGETGLGANIYIDYLLPISIPLSLGAEIGVDNGHFKPSTSFGSNQDTVTVVPILLRAAYHFDISPQIDLYAVGKIGIAFASWSGYVYDTIKADNNANPDSLFGVGVGIDLGVGYYFTPVFGLFGEGGFDGYFLKSEANYVKNGQPGNTTVRVPFYRYLTVGVSLKF